MLVLKVAVKSSSSEGMHNYLRKNTFVPAIDSKLMMFKSSKNKNIIANK